MFQKKYTSRAIIPIFVAVLFGFYIIPLHITHAQVISNLINQIVNTVAPSNPSSSDNPVIITPAAVDVPVQSVTVPVPSVTVTTPVTTVTASPSNPTPSASPVVSSSPRPIRQSPSPSATPRPSTSPSTSPKASTTTATTTQATTTAGTVSNPDNTISGSATNYYQPLNSFSLPTTIGLSGLAILIGIWGAFSMLRIPVHKKPALKGGYSPRPALQVQEPLLDQQ